MRASLHVIHYSSCKVGQVLKRKFLDWQKMIVDLRKNGDLGKNALLDHLNKNYAIGMIKSAAGEVYFYSSCAIKNRDAYHNFKLKVDKYKNYKWGEMVRNLHFNSDPSLYSYIEVDRSRGIRSPASWCRKHDSESVILEKISEYMFIHRLFDCEVFIYSQKEPCLNCETVFQQFLERHSLLKLTIFYNQTNYHQLPSKYNWRYK